MKDPLQKLLKKIKVISIRLFPVQATKLIFRLKLGYRLNLNDPKTFSEKTQWLKLKFYPQYDLAALAGDKATLHDYLSEKRLEKYEVPIIGIYNNFTEIKWDEIPDKFVVKKSNACDMNAVINNKESVDIKKLKKTTEKWMSRDYGKETAEYHYCNMESKIVIEKFMEGIEKEYQFYTFNGTVRALQIMEFQVKSSSKKISEGKIIHNRDYININDFAEKNLLPELNELIDTSEKIGVDFPLSRVDFFFSNGRWYIGEITLTPTGGFNPINEEQQKEWGDWLELPVDF